MAERIEFERTGDGNVDHGVHFVDGIQDYTLCSITLDGDPSTGGGYSVTKKKVDCKDCKRIVRYCKSIRSTEMSVG